MQPPLIIIGMHRSGTSLVTRLLSQLGLFTGADWDPENSESIFFQGINDQVLQAAGASWHQPSPMRGMLLDSARCQRWSTTLAGMCESAESSRYTGTRRSQPLRPMLQPWGWKDPRNTLTLPLWLRVFPQARVLHVVRNGIDVSQSLIERERRFSARAWVRFKREIIRPLVPESWRPSRPRACTTLSTAFALWVDYLEFAAEAIRDLPAERLLEVRFEDLVAEPGDRLGAIARFAGLNAAEQRIRETASRIDVQRSYAFLTDPELRAFYEANRRHELMQQHDYAEFIPPKRSPARTPSGPRSSTTSPTMTVKVD